MPRRDLKKSKTEGLYKQCRHLSWDKCECPWWGRVKGQRVSLQKWAGEPIRNKEKAKAVLVRMEGAVFANTFDKRGEKAALLSSDITFGTFLDEYHKRHIQEDGLRSNSVDSYLAVFKVEFGADKLSQLACDPYRFEKWLKDLKESKKWAHSTFNRYVEHGRAMFNWARKRKLVSENPFEAIGLLDEQNERSVRISPEDEQRLLDGCALLDSPPPSKLVKVTPHQVDEIRKRVESGEQQKDVAAFFRISRPLISQIVNGKVRKPPSTTMGPEMKRRVIAAIDLGLRQGEMLKLQVKHVDFDNWTILLPKEITKAKKDQLAYAMTDRLQKVLEERKSLGPEGFIFGKQNGRFVASFDKTWKKLFQLAGLQAGRKGGVVWHDLRHEYGSYLADQDVKIHELKALMRHQDIRTTARYLTARDERLRELAGKMGQRIKEKGA
jgi:integrase